VKSLFKIFVFEIVQSPKIYDFLNEQKDKTCLLNYLKFRKLNWLIIHNYQESLVFQKFLFLFAKANKKIKKPRGKVMVKQRSLLFITFIHSFILSLKPNLAQLLSIFD